MARGPFRPELNSVFQSAFGDYAGPFIVKPVSGRASLHVHVAESRAELPDMVQSVYQVTQNTVLIEKYLSGREFCIGVAGPVVARQRRLVREGRPFTLSAIERVFEAKEKIFTSMDTKPITDDRLKKLDPKLDKELLERMRVLACDVYREFNLSSLVRLDLRGDAEGNLYVLEANPKPDLKQPAEGVTSLLCAGLPDCGMDYDDLILSLMADRLDFLFTHRQETVSHIIDLLKTGPNGTSSAANMQATMKQPEKRVPLVTAVDMQRMTRPANDEHRQGAPVAGNQTPSKSTHIDDALEQLRRRVQVGFNYHAGLNIDVGSGFGDAEH